MKLSLITVTLSLLPLASAVVAAEAPGRWQTLAKDLQSDVVAVRRAAARQLAQRTPREAVPALIQALDDAEPAVRSDVARALAAVKDSRATPALVRHLGDADPSVRCYAAYALGEIHDRQAAGALLAALEDPAWVVREQAAWALREIGDRTVATQLVDRIVGRQAAGRGPRDTTGPGPSPQQLRQILWILQRLERPAVLTQLKKHLQHPSAGARQRVVVALGALGTDDTWPDLVRVTLADAAPEVRLAAIRVLARAHQGGVIESLARVAERDHDPRVRQAAQHAVDQWAERSGLSAHWSFDEQPPHATIVRDVSGNGNDGRRMGGAAYVPGKLGLAVQCGPGAFVELGRPVAIPVGNRAFSVMAWVKTAAADGVVVARGGAFCGFSLYLKEGRPKFGIHCEQEGPSYIAAAPADQAVNDDQWTHLTGVVQRDQIQLYVNGQLAAEAATEGFLPGDCGQGMEIGFDAGNSPAELVTACQGLIDEVKVYESAVSPAEIALEMRRQ